MWQWNTQVPTRWLLGFGRLGEWLGGLGGAFGGGHFGRSSCDGDHALGIKTLFGCGYGRDRLVDNVVCEGAWFGGGWADLRMHGGRLATSVPHRRADRTLRMGHWSSEDW